ncbi:phospholipase/carboxylesterase [Xylariomycetidae sp. FL0641]|nr:phospholipase/carboxylesterase [Xylariomycetidae sp. FL0641]
MASSPSSRGPSNHVDKEKQVTYIVEPTVQHKFSIMLLHGRGSNGKDFGRELLDTGVTSNGSTLAQLLPGARWIFPTAPLRRACAFNRCIIRQWFDIARVSNPLYRKEVQLQGLAESVVELRALLEQETSRIPSENIVLGGISNGCAMSLSMLLSLEHPLGGFIGMSGYLPWQEDIEEELREWKDRPEPDDDLFESEHGDSEQSGDPAVKALVFVRDLLCVEPLVNPSREQTACSTPVFLGHGALDEKKPYREGEAAARTMRAAGYQVEWKLYPNLGHWYQVPEEIDDIVEFIRDRLTGLAGSYEFGGHDI